jgi:hypothetical protein
MAILDWMSRPGFVLAALAVAGCGLRHGARSVDPGAATSPAVEQRTVVIEHGFISFTLEIPRERAGPKPAVITFLDRREPMHDAGWVTIQYQIHWEVLRGLSPPSPPPSGGLPSGTWEGQAEAAPQHEIPPGSSPTSAPATVPRTWGKWLLASPDPGTVGRGYFQLIDLQANYVIPKVIDALASVPEVDSSRIAVVGFSTAGFVALQAAKDRRIRTVVALSTTGDYPCFLEGSPLGMDGEPLQLDPSYRRFLLSRDPERHPQRLLHAAVLLVAGREDLAMPLACVERTAARLRSAYERAGVPERFRFIVLERGHQVDADARFETMVWLQRWLVRREGSR